MQLLYSKSGTPAGSAEQVDVLFDAAAPGVPVDVTFPIKSPLGPGAIVIVTLVQPFPAVFLVFATAELTAVGICHAQFFNLNGIAESTLPVHVLVFEHEGDP